MHPNNSKQQWIDTGYELFGADGLDGLQVERLARVMNLNKSGFYHYFKSRELFLDDLFLKHENESRAVALAFSAAPQFDPDFFTIILDNHHFILFHQQLVRYRHVAECNACYQRVSAVVDQGIARIFSDYMGIHDAELSAKFFDQVRDMFFARINAKNLNEEFLRALVRDVREVAIGFSR
ncbi:MAG: TetR/AcrR family transcriptional regulator [Cyclobacteriaceae bacterium]|nr:TetR/AcrR family transcriptional regulator [Cyclobacteriaceae bacterium]